MKATGIVRRVDELGRIVLPIELRRTLDITERDALEIYVEGSSVILKKYRPSCIFCDGVKDVSVFRGKNVCAKCLRNGVENCIMCPSAERTRRRSSPNQSTRTGKNGHVYAPQTLFRSDGIDVRRAGAAYCDHTERSVTTWTLQRPAPIWRHFERRRA